MRRFLLLSLLVFLLSPSYKDQSATVPSENSAVMAESAALLSDLQNLNTETAELDAPLARALSKAEIADAAWPLDQAWAKKLLREAYELTLPDEAERAKLRDRPAGAAPTLPTDVDRARDEVRNRVLAVAGRDKAFADQLAQLGAQQLGSYEEHFTYASLASQAIKAGDTAAASGYIQQSINADPTQITAGASILELAARDRKAADALTLQYIERLQTVPLSMENQSAVRVYVTLAQIVSPNSNMLSGSRRISPPGPDVMRAYVGYVIESMGALEQREPGSAMRLRSFLLQVWLPLKQYAPDLAGAFLQLEALSRRPGEDFSLPSKGAEDSSRDSYDARVKSALDGGRPDDSIINLAISRGDFDKARKMIDRLPDGAQKTELTEMTNLREAFSLTGKGDIAAAETLAGQLNKAVSVLQIYPVIMRTCAAAKDSACVMRTFDQAVRQLKRADATGYTPPAGIPASIAPSGRESDPVLSSLSKLVKAVLPVSDVLAFEALDETVSAANRSEVDTGQGRVGFDIDIFKILAPKSEPRVRAAALGLKDRLRKIVALAVIDQWKAAELTKKTKSVPNKEAGGN